MNSALSHFLTFSSSLRCPDKLRDQPNWAHIMSLFHFFSTTTVFLLPMFFLLFSLFHYHSRMHILWYTDVLLPSLFASTYRCFFSKLELNALMRSFNPLISCNCEVNHVFGCDKSKSFCLPAFLIIRWFGFLSNPNSKVWIFKLKRV